MQLIIKALVEKQISILNKIIAEQQEIINTLTDCDTNNSAHSNILQAEDKIRQCNELLTSTDLSVRIVVKDDTTGNVIFLSSEVLEGSP